MFVTMLLGITFNKRKAYGSYVHYTFNIIYKEYVIKIMFIMIMEFIHPTHS